ncbi:hypothetical protein Mal15_17780 [Stieleria maiorica]|uniref:Uncharacterized protein n=1 Tax=Stieleria maiorica TaxID=2795974 RepID=A0A5B9MDR0_9BACT|nr:hypothetical protein [Stieleria maiorica]QEF97734.1 hypothetical protein Mal15_17780 [Stieleria maiorica]
MSCDDVDQQLEAFFSATPDHDQQSAESGAPNFNNWDAILQGLPEEGPIAIGRIEIPHPAKVKLAILALSRLGRKNFADLMDHREVQLYQHNGRLAHVVPRHGSSPARVAPIGKDRLKELLPVAISNLEFIKPSEWSWLIKSVDAANTYTPIVPELKGIARVPRLALDGTVQDLAGYDGHGWYCDLMDEWEPIQFVATAEDARQLIDEVVLAPFEEFPFETGADRSAYLMLLFSAAFEYLIDGRTPLFAIDGDRAGLGKSLLAESPSLLVHERKHNRPANPTNMMLELLSIVRKRMPIALFDNLRLAINSEALESFVTSSHWSGRERGTMGMIDEPNHTVVIVTGNRLAYRGDLWRRVVPIRLKHPGDDRPTKYKVRDVHTYLAEHRSQMLNATVAAMQRFILDGMPQTDRDPFRSFERFDYLIRGLVLYLGYPDPLDPARLPKEDTDQRRLRLLIAGLAKAGADENPMTAADLINRLTESPDDQQVLGEIAELIARGKDGKVTPTTLSRALQEHVGLRYGGYVLVAGRKKNNTCTFRIVRAPREEHCP